jgi:hypothetical protein
MSKDSGGSQTVTQKIDPAARKAYLDQLAQAKSVAGQLGVQQFADFNPLYQQGEEQLTNLGLKPFDATAIQEFMNPYEAQVIQGTLGDIEQSRMMAANQVANQASAAKAFGGSRYGVQQSLTDAAALQQAAKTSAQMRQAGYGQAAGLAMNARNLGMQGAQAVMGLGSARQQLEQARLDAARNIGLQKLAVTGAAVGLQPANLGGTSSQPLYQNQGAGALGGALAGAQLGSIVPGIGTGIGAGIGGLIGLLG